MKTADEMYSDIRGYEIEHGESFLDHFDGDFGQPSFMFWCLGKGYIDAYKFDKWYEENERQWSCIGCELIYGDEEYSIVKELDDWEAPYEKAMRILAEFLVSTTVYQERVKEFLEGDDD